MVDKEAVMSGISNVITVDDLGIVGVQHKCATCGQKIVMPAIVKADHTVDVAIKSVEHTEDGKHHIELW